MLRTWYIDRQGHDSGDFELRNPDDLNPYGLVDRSHRLADTAHPHGKYARSTMQVQHEERDIL